MNEMKPRNIENSPYKQLYASINDMLQHGKSIADARVTKLATELTHDLIRFEDDPTHYNRNVKNEFRTAFLDKLHSEDEYFTTNQHNPIKSFLGAIYKSLYINVFTDVKYHFQSSLFKKTTTEDSGQLKPPEPI